MQFFKTKTFLFIFLSYIVFFILIPPFQIPDEPEHFENIYWVAHLKYPYLPTKNETRPNLFVDPIITLYDWNKVNSDGFVLLNFQRIKSAGNIQYKPENLDEKSSQAYHPPVFYLFGTILFKLAEIFYLGSITQYYVVRLTSTFFYFASIIVGFAILKKFFKSVTVINSLLVFFAINPTTLKMGVGINNEIATVFFSLLYLNLILKTASPVKAGFFAALAGLSKFSGIFTALSYALTTFIRNKFSKKSLINYLKFLVVFFPFIGIWLYFNSVRYGNPLQDNFALICKKDFPSYDVLTTAFYSLFEFRHTINHYAGFLGWGEPMPFKWFFVAYTLVFVLICLIGLISLIRRQAAVWKTLLTHIFSLFAFLFILDFYRKSLNYSCDIQGRYLLPVFLPITIVLAFGLGKLLKINIEKSSRLLMFFAIFQYYFILIFVLLPYYYV